MGGGRRGRVGGVGAVRAVPSRGGGWTEWRLHGARWDVPGPRSKRAWGAGEHVAAGDMTHLCPWHTHLLPWHVGTLLMPGRMHRLARTWAGSGQASVRVPAWRTQVPLLPQPDPLLLGPLPCCVQLPQLKAEKPGGPTHIGCALPSADAVLLLRLTRQPHQLQRGAADAGSGSGPGPGSGAHTRQVRAGLLVTWVNTE